MSPFISTRRAFLGTSSAAIGQLALASLMNQECSAAAAQQVMRSFAPKAKRVICLFQSGGPSHIDLFDGKPSLYKHHGKDLPPSVRGDQRVTGMTSGQSSFPVVQPLAEGKPCGPAGVWISNLLPWTQKIAGEICVVRSMHTEAINHDPAITFCQTGSQLAGRPSIGSWLSYGLGSENQDLPAYVVLTSFGTGRPDDQPLYDRLWGAGFLPSKHQGVKFRNRGDAVLYLSNPKGIDAQRRRKTLDRISELNAQHHEQLVDPEIQTRISQYEMAFRMQSSVPDLTDLSDETEKTFELYGPDAKKPGTFAANCLLARRMVERGVRFVQLYHRGWDNHGNLPSNIPKQCKDIDQPQAALVKDLKERGLLDDTIVIWGGEFGRTVYSQGSLQDDYGRDHHGRCFSMWMAGGGFKPGANVGQTDDYGYNIVEQPVHIHDLQATLLHCLGFDHERLTYRYQGRDFRLTDVHGKVCRELLEA